jgi:hypothetical protein
MTPTVLLALVNAMSSQELINNVSSLKKRGAFDSPEIKASDRGEAEGRADGEPRQRVQGLQGDRGQRRCVSTETKAALEKVADQQIKRKGRIQRPTALLIDKSGSMAVAIELGKRIGAMISAVCEKELFVYAFDNMAYPIERAAGDDLASWERALMGITAGGATSCGVSIQAMLLKKQYVEQIILVTDEGENTGPHFVPTLEKYRAEMKADPACASCARRAAAAASKRSAAAGVMVDVFQFAGDYYSLPNLVPLLSKPSKLELLMEIMEYPLPVRKSCVKLNVRRDAVERRRHAFV